MPFLTLKCVLLHILLFTITALLALAGFSMVLVLFWSFSSELLVPVFFFPSWTLSQGMTCPLSIFPVLLKSLLF